MKKNIANNGADPDPVIALKAYQLWEAAERPEDKSLEFWFQAEEELTVTQDLPTTQPATKKTRRKALPEPKAKGPTKDTKKPAVMAKAPAKRPRSKT